MTHTIEMTRIGTAVQEGGYTIAVEPEFRAALKGLGDFSHVLVLWVFDKAPWDGKTLVYPPCYKKLTTEIGLFATRGPFRPSPVAVSLCRLLSADEATGAVTVDWLDAEPGSPVIDLKPYHPSSDAVRDFSMPDWCAHWPRTREDSDGFDWSAEFTY